MDKPTPVPSFNPEGKRFIACQVGPHGRLILPEPGHIETSIWRWDPPEGYNKVVTCNGMQGVDHITQAQELAQWYNERYPPHPLDSTGPDGENYFSMRG
jgi:hypothetical protein